MDALAAQGLRAYQPGGSVDEYVSSAVVAVQQSQDAGGKRGGTRPTRPAAHRGRLASRDQAQGSQPGAVLGDNKSATIKQSVFASSLTWCWP